MGIVFKVCHNCECTFPDCGYFTRCNDGCYAVWCSDECAEEEGWNPEGGSDEEKYPGETWPTCDLCRGESAEDYALFSYALQKLGVSRGELEAEYLSRK